MSSLLIPIQMRFGDIDSYGHVNNVTMLQYLEDARVRLMARPLPAVRLYDGDRARTVWAATAGQLDVPVTACGETVAPHGILPAWFPLVAGDEVAAER